MSTYLQSERPLQIETPLGADKLLLLAFHGTERLSECYRLVLDLGSEDEAVDGAGLLRKMVTVKVQLAAGGERQIHGWVTRFSQLHRDERLTYYQAEIVPAFWFLSLWRDCRIFQHKDALQIVEQVLGDRSIKFDKQTTKTPATREYCVQYRESDLDFVSRLLEEEGIFFYFDHSGQQDVLVLADATTSLADCAQSRVRVDPQLQQDEDVIISLQAEHAVHTSKVTLTDYNMEKPSTSLLRSVDSTTTGKGEEFYDYPGGYATGDAGQARATLLIEEAETQEQVVRGTSNCRAFESGTRFTLAGHFQSSLDQQYVLVAVEHTAESGLYRSGEAAIFHYDNKFVAIPSSRKYRPPPVHAKPIVHGSQTAVVVGPSGEEIYVDKYGRVKVQFFWDRLGEKNENSSCWVRVSTQWAGKNWGMIHIPRIGQEVIVDFLEGDPDHPILTGSVYNAEQMPPYDLPANMTQSGIKSRSTKQGGTDNFNEIRFEDKKGNEVVNVQAEKDLKTLVKNDETREVQHDRITTIKNDETRTVTEGNDVHTVKKGDQTVTVEQGKQTIEVKQGDQAIIVGQGKQTVDVKMGDQAITVGQGNRTVDVKMGNETTTIDQGNHALAVKMGNQTTTLDMGNQTVELKMGNRTVKLDLGKIAEEAMQGIELKVGANSIKIDQTGVTIKGMMVKVEGQIQTQIKGMMTQVNGDAMLMVKGGITMIN